MQPGDQVTWFVTDTMPVPAIVVVVDEATGKVQLQRGDRRPWVRLDEVKPHD